MNYKRAYESIISSRKQNKAEGLIERHHIIPKCLGGGDNIGNIVELTPREHYVCHYLLAKIHGGSLWSAYYFMSHAKTNSGRGVRVTSKMYDAARKGYIKYLKTKTGEKNSNYGNSYSQESRIKISIARGKYTKKHHPRAINTEQEWRHISGEIFIGSHFSLSEITGLSSDALRKVAKGDFFSHKGWACHSSGRKNMRLGDMNNTADKKVYVWTSSIGEVFEGTRCSAKESLGLSSGGTGNLIRGIIKKHKGWSVSL